MKKSLYAHLCTLTVVIAAAALVVGCDSNNGNPVNPDSGDARLILEDGYAWVYQVENGFLGVTQAGYIFNENYTGLEIAFLGTWFVTEMEWSVDGNKLSIPSGSHVECDNNGCITTVIVSEYTYSFSGGKLILSDDEDTIELVKTWVGDIGGEVGGEFDPALVNTSWIYEDPETGEIATWFFTFNEDEQTAVAFYTLVDADDELIDMGMYICSTSDGTLNLTGLMGSQNATYTYSVSGDELTVDGVTYTLEDRMMFKKLSQKLPKVKLPKRLGLLK